MVGSLLQINAKLRLISCPCTITLWIRPVHEITITHIAVHHSKPPELEFHWFFFFFGWGKRREMHHAYCEGLQNSLPVGLLACWAVCCLTYPLKPPSASVTGHIPLWEIYCWVWFSVEVSKAFITPEGSEFSLVDQFLLVFHEACFNPTLSYEAWY